MRYVSAVENFCRLRLVPLAGCGALVAACGSASNGASPGTSDAGATDSGAADAARADAADGASGNPDPGCTVTATGASGVALRATLLLPGGPMDGEVFVDSTGKIACAGASCSSSAGYAGAAHVTCTNAVVSPGFVNAHDHTDYDHQPPAVTGKTRYQHRNEWRTGADGATPIHYQSYSDDPKVLASSELRFLMSGVTSIVGSGGIGGLVRNLALSQYTNASTEGLTGKTVYFDVFPLGDSNGVILDSGCKYPTVVSTTSAFYDGVFAPHFAEGIDQGAENEIICAESAALGLVTSQTTVLHAVGTNAKDVAGIQTAGAKVVWAPRSNIMLYGNTMPVTEMKYAGVPIALGTDWLPTGSMNMLRELQCADSLNAKYFGGAFTDQELVQMATSNGAAAMGFGSQIGTIAAGMEGDLVVFAAGSQKGWRTPIEASVEDVELVMRGGKVLYGDATLVKAVRGADASGCEAMSVCGTSKSVCLDVTGVTLSDVQAAAGAAYPLFFCRGQTPTNEPTCIPYRDTYPNGTSATDRDGDGVPDSSDDCQAVFNPPRSMDGDKQSDVDGDGAGDACDARPLDPSSH
jgi:hypothetical protein